MKLWANISRLSRNDYEKLQKAVGDEDPNAALHRLCEEGFINAPHLITGSGTMIAPASLEEMWEAKDADRAGDSVGPVADEDTHEEASSIMGAVELGSAIETALKRLGARERAVIELYYGLSGNDRLNLREIGDRFGVTESRISQLHVRALRELAQFMGARSDSPTTL